jgi:AcrR family transcriptional regulator
MAVEGATTRRIGTTDSKTRAKLLDVAERLLLAEGYPAVTSRRLGREAGLSNQLVHYYFRTMDDLFLEVFRRRAEEGFARFRRAMDSDPSLRTVWAFSSGGPGARFNLEFAALANHRKTVRDEMAATAERFRAMQLDAIADVLPEGLPAEVVLLAMNGVGQVMALEQALGVASGHDATVEYIEGLIDEIDGRAKQVFSESTEEQT